MIFAWTFGILLVAIIICIIWRWSRKNELFISKEGRKKYDDYLKMSTGEIIDKKKEIK